MKKLMILLLPLALAGCSVDYECAVFSNSSWSGTFGNRTVAGDGNMVVDIPDSPPQCAVVCNEEGRGYLRIQIQEKGGWFLNPPTSYQSVQTQAPYGCVTACSEE